MADNPVKFSDLFNLSPEDAALLDGFGKAVRGLRTNYKNFADGLEKDGARVAQQLGALTAQFAAIRQQGAQVDTLVASERGALAGLQAQVTALLGEQQRLKAAQDALAKSQKVVTDATAQAQSANRALQNELREAYKAQDTARITAAATAIRNAKTETQSLSQALRGTNSELTAARGSYDALDAQNKRLIATLKALGDAEGDNREKAAALEAQIAQNTQQLRAFDERILVYTRNVGNYKGGFAELVAQLARAQAAQAGMSQGTAAYAEQQTKIIGFQTAAQKSAASMGLSYEQAEARINGASEALRPLATQLTRLEAEQQALAKTTGTETEEYRKLGFQLASTKKQLDDTAAATVATESKQSGLADQLGFSKAGLTQYAGTLVAGTLGLQALDQASQEVFLSNVEFSRELAEVRKTTGLTADEADRLAVSLKDLDTPTNMAGLLKIAAVGGQLGIAKDDLLGFTQAIDTAVQALGNDFQGGAEEIATTLGKISTVYRRELGPDVAQNILAIGSAINQISADGAATAPFLADVAQRTGALSASFGVGLQNTLAYAAVLQETGSTAEVAGTSLNRLYSTLSTRTKAAYDIAKNANPALTLKEFSHLVNTDFNQAVQLFLRGLNEGGKSTTDQARLLATLKLQSGEAKAAIVTLAQNTELFAERQKTANDQLRDATSLGAEAAINTETLAGSVDKLKNNASELVTGGALGGILKFLTDFVAFDFKLLTAGFRGIGDSFVYLGQKAGLVDKPLTDYTTSLVDTALASRKSAAANQELLDSYVQLSAVQGRTAAQELEYEQTRARLLQQFGTAEAAAVQQRIEGQRQVSEGTVKSLKFDLQQYDNLIAESQAKASAAQQEINAQADQFTANQLARARQIAEFRVTGSNATPASQEVLDTKAPDGLVAANVRLAESEKNLAERQRLRGQVLAALVKLEQGATQARQDGTGATEKEAAAEAQLDRTAEDAAKRRLRRLNNDLEDNQRRLADARAYLAEQGKLFDDHQISKEVLAENVAGAQDILTAAERRGTALRISIARAESAAKLAELNQAETKELGKKKITESQVTEIQRHYASERQAVAETEVRAIEKINREAGERQGKADPLEFKVPQFDEAKYLEDLGRRNLLTYQRRVQDIRAVQEAADADNLQALANKEINETQYDARRRANRKKTDEEILKADQAFHKATLADQKQANEDALDDEKAALEKKLKLIEKVGEYTQFAEQSFYQIKGNFIDQQIQDENAAYDNELKVAGDNAKLKEQIEKDHQKRLAKLNYDKAKSERDSALFSIAINTAVAAAKDLATYGFPFALGPIAADLAIGAVQAAVVLTKPLPAYFRGRSGGPAETAIVGDRGPELYGQPSTGYRLATRPTVVRLEQHDVVHTAAETRQLLATNRLVEDRIQYRTAQAGTDRQFTLLRQGEAARQAAERSAQQASTHAVVERLDRVERAIKQQQYYRLNEQNDLVRRIEQENGRRDKLDQRYRFKKP